MSKRRIVMESQGRGQLCMESNIDVISALCLPSHPQWGNKHAFRYAHV